MLTGPITGIDPFVNWSTFRGPSLVIPRGLFYGGIFYTSEDYDPPCHISYISGRDEVCLSTWGIADANGKELAQIYFYDESSDDPLSGWGANVGHIIDINGAYSGCLKGRLYHYYDTSVEGSEEPSDLVVFLNNLSGEHTLDTDSLILDVCVCCKTPIARDAVAKFNSIELPEGCACVPDDNGHYYIRHDQYSPDTNAVKSLTFSTGDNSETISGEHLLISPYTLAPTVSGSIITVVDANNKVIRGTGTVNYDESTADVGEDIGIDILDGGIVIGRRGKLNEVGK